VLCKHEVVGSIPSGSTTLRPSGYAWRRRAWRSKRARRSSKSEDGLTIEAQSTEAKNIVRETSLRALRPNGRACGISDIVKRRSIRVLDLQSNLRNPVHNLQVISALAHRKMGGL
jgi:hypothetical protein